MKIFGRYSTTLLLAVLAAGCGTTKTTSDSGPGPDDDGGTDGGGPVTFTMTTVQNAYNTATGALKDMPIEIDNAVVISAYSFLEDGVPDGTFYIQDSTSTNGIAVYHGKADMTIFPNIGDIVNVQGKLAYYDASLQIASSTKYNIPLNITHVGTGGMAPATSGAMPPAGSPIMIHGDRIATDYSYSVPQSQAHAEQIGNVLQFEGPLVITQQYPTGVVIGDAGYPFQESKADGGTPDSQGFQVGFQFPDGGVSDGLWIYDYNTYYDCMKGLGPDGGTLYPTLTNGVRGVWDRYQDYYGGSMAPIYPILVPMGCPDYLGGAPLPDGGTYDGGSTDAGSADAGSTTGSTDAGPADAGATDAGPG